MNPDDIDRIKRQIQDLYLIIATLQGEIRSIVQQFETVHGEGGISFIWPVVSGAALEQRVSELERGAPSDEVELWVNENGDDIFLVLDGTRQVIS